MALGHEAVQSRGPRYAGSDVEGVLGLPRVLRRRQAGFPARAVGLHRWDDYGTIMRSRATPFMKSKLIITTLSLLALCAGIIACLTGCQTAKSTRTTTNPSTGATATDTIEVRSFFASITSGQYATTNAEGSRVLSVDVASPDQKSIATAVGGFTDLAKIIIPFLATNRPAPVTPNPPPVIIVSNTFVLPK